MTSSDASFDPLADISPATMPRFLGAALDYPGGTTIDWHRHETGQLVHAVAGSMRLFTESTVVLLPPTMAVWVPPARTHRLEFSRPAAMRTLYVRPGDLPRTDRSCRVLAVSPLLRELILAVMPDTVPAMVSRRRRALFDLLAAELAEAPEVTLTLPLPGDDRIRPLAERALADPGAVGSVTAWTATAAASAKTVERLFRRQTGLTPSQWLRQARLMAAVAWLAEGRSVTTIALDLGYGTPSAFSYMFRRALGVAPSRFLAGLATN
jgi:AraC-like DNA-binding protein